MRRLAVVLKATAHACLGCGAPVKVEHRRFYARDEFEIVHCEAEIVVDHKCPASSVQGTRKLTDDEKAALDLFIVEFRAGVRRGPKAIR